MANQPQKSKTETQSAAPEKEQTESVFKDNEIRGESTFEIETGDTPSPLDEIGLHLRVAMEGGSVKPLRNLIANLIVEADEKEAVVLRDQLMRLRMLGEAAAQSAQEAYMARS